MVNQTAELNEICTWHLAIVQSTIHMRIVQPTVQPLYIYMRAIFHIANGYIIQMTARYLHVCMPNPSTINIKNCHAIRLLLERESPRQCEDGNQIYFT